MTESPQPDAGEGRASPDPASEVLLEAVLDAIPDVLGVQDRHHRILRYNAAGYAFLGLRPEKVHGRRCFELIGRNAPCPVCATSESYRTRRPARVEKYVEEMDLWLDVRSYPILDENGEVVRIIEHLRDITREKRSEEERRRLEEKVLHMQKLESLGVLAGGIAHDFNNLLMGILGNADLARNGLPVSSPVRPFLRGIEEAARKAAGLSRQMLAYSGRGRFLVEMLDLSALVREMADLMKVSLSKKVSLRLDLPPDLPLLEGDATQLSQVVMNLMTNASEAVGDGEGLVSVRTGSVRCDRAYLRSGSFDDELPEGLYVFLEVSDNGCGMSAETQDKLFDPFFTTKFTGRGLGLSAVLGIVRGHRGSVKVYSEEGRGTSIKILLPAAAQGRPDAPEPSRASALSGEGLVLLADDEAIARDVAGRMIRSLGFDVVTAENGAEALEMFRSRSQEVCCAIVDLTMPRMDGEECYRALRELRPDLPVVLTSGYSQDEVSARFLGKEPAGFLQKPFLTEELEAVLHRALGGGGAGRDKA